MNLILQCPKCKENDEYRLEDYNLKDFLDYELPVELECQLCGHWWTLWVQLKPVVRRWVDKEDVLSGYL